MRSEILLMSESAEDPFRSELGRAISEELAKVAASIHLKEQDTPQLREIPFDQVPAAADLSPLALLMPILPAAGGRFDPEVETHFASHLANARTEGDRILPVCHVHARAESPAPLDQLVAAHVHDLADAMTVQRLVRRALIMMDLRLTGGAGIFISYRTSDGLPAATSIADKLAGRGYSVWRDENRDQDDIPLIQPGTPVQRTIREAIAERGFVLLIDTPQALDSAWVREEVSTAIETMLPILPVVVAPAPLQPGSRFEAVARFAYVELGANALDHQHVDQEVETQLDRIEEKLVQVVTSHARTRRRLIANTRDAFESLGFRYGELAPAELLFVAERSLDDVRTPGLRLRMLVQCCPYRRIPQPFIERLRMQFYMHNGRTLSRYQYLVLMHNAAAARPEYASVVGADSHFLLLDPTDLVDVFVKHGFAPHA